MTVKDIFDLRRQGRIEEAYEAIRPLYAAHKGRYTTLCMFWTAIDVLKKRIDEGRLSEAEKIHEALKRMLPRVEALEQETDQHPQVPQPQPSSAPQRMPLPWEYGHEDNSASSAAAAVLQSAARRLNKANNELCGGDTNSSHLVEESDKEVNHDKLSDRSQQIMSDKPSDTPTPQEAKAVLTEEPVREPSGDIIRPIEGLNAIQRVVLACVVGHPGYSAPKISESTGIPQSLVEHHITVLTDRNLIEYRDTKNACGYYLKEM